MLMLWLVFNGSEIDQKAFNYTRTLKKSLAKSSLMSFIFVFAVPIFILRGRYLHLFSAD